MKNLKTINGKLLAMLLIMFSIVFVQSCDNDDDVVPVVKTELSATIATANDLIASTEEGTANGQYVRGSQQVLQDVIDIAGIVNANPLATQTEVDNSVVAVEAAITVYEAAEIIPIAPDALVGHWAFDAGTGTTAKDYSDNGYDGTFGNEAGFGSGAATWTTDRYGDANKAIAFDLGAKITVPYSAAINPKQITIALWVNVAETRANNRFIGLHSWNGYKFQTQDADKSFFTASAADGIYDKDTDPSLNLNTWYHLAVTFGGGEMVFYVNGVKTITHDALTGDLVTVVGHDLVFGVGSSKYATTADNYDTDKIIPIAWGGYYHGILDEIRLYNTVLSATQIESIYNVEKP